MGPKTPALVPVLLGCGAAEGGNTIVEHGDHFVLKFTAPRRLAASPRPTGAILVTLRHYGAMPSLHSDLLGYVVPGSIIGHPGAMTAKHRGNYDTPTTVEFFFLPTDTAFCAYGGICFFSRFGLGHWGCCCLHINTTDKIPVQTCCSYHSVLVFCC